MSASGEHGNPLLPDPAAYFTVEASAWGSTSSPSPTKSPSRATPTHKLLAAWASAGTAARHSPPPSRGGPPPRRTGEITAAATEGIGSLPGARVVMPASKVQNDRQERAAAMASEAARKMDTNEEGLAEDNEFVAAGSKKGEFDDKYDANGDEVMDELEDCAAVDKAENDRRQRARGQEATNDELKADSEGTSNQRMPCNA